MIPFVDLKSQYVSLKKEIDRAVAGVLSGGQYVGGETVASFERDFAAYNGNKYAIAVANGTEALYLALRSLDIGKGDEVITVPNTFMATVEAITLTGARPVFVDIDPLTYTMAAGGIAAKITRRTKAIIPVHLYGQPAEMEEINRLARQQGLTVVEDACQAHGAEYKSCKTGSLGQLGCFSFYPSKNLGAYGDGGIVVTNKTALDRKIRILRDHGQSRKYRHDLDGMNSRLDTLQAAILKIKLRYLDQWNEQRLAQAKYYNQLLSGIKDISLPGIWPGTKPVFHLYVIQARQRDKLQSYLQSAGIQTGIHYPFPLHLQRAFKWLGYRRGDFPVTEKAARRILSLPMYPELEARQIDFIVAKIKGFLGEK